MTLNQKHALSLLDFIREIVVFKKTCQNDKNRVCIVKSSFKTRSGVLWVINVGITQSFVVSICK